MQINKKTITQHRGENYEQVFHKIKEIKMTPKKPFKYAQSHSIMD